MLKGTTVAIDAMVERTTRAADRWEKVSIDQMSPEILRLQILTLLRNQVTTFQHLGALCMLLDLVRQGVPIPPARMRYFGHPIVQRRRRTR
jgi:hypothetical protein